MKQAARLAAAIEVIDQIVSRHQPVAIALSDWGKAHRFAGSGDRDAIGRYVYDAMRLRASSAYIMQAETPRAIVFGSLLQEGMLASDLAALLTGIDHAPPPLTGQEAACLVKADLDAAPDWIAGNYPEWLQPSLERAFGANLRAQMAAFATRAPADIRVNTLKATREKVLKALADFGALPAPFVPNGIRIPPPVGPARTPNLQAEAAFQAGWCEIQDTGSQIAAAMTLASPRQQVLDLCAGAGGKTLALAAAMQNTGQLFAYDSDRERLKPIYDRIKRAGVRNAQVLRGADRKAVDALGPRFDCVLADAPCSGSGTWRRRPDSKWRLRPHALSERQKEQDAVLAHAATFVKPGGRLVYVTCSILPEENSDRIAAFTGANPDFSIVPYGDVWCVAFESDPPPSADGRSDTLLLTPQSHATDGFFIAVLEKRP
jgi:16S rRNA (cytosine967-C5)-methyltransferase